MNVPNHDAPRNHTAASLPKNPLYAGLIVVILLLPLPVALPPAGHRMPAILAFAIVVWLTEAVSYEASTIVITSLIALLVGTAPTVNDPSVTYGMSNAIGMALAGFPNSALVLVAGALFIPAAMTVAALETLPLIGTTTRRIQIGAVAITIVLSLVVAGATARSACVVPIMIGVISAVGVDKRLNIAAGIRIIVTRGTSVWNVGIPTAAAQNPLTVGFMDKIPGGQVTWLDWLVACVPWAIIMSAVLIFAVLKIMPPEIDSIAGGKEARALAARARPDGRPTKKVCPAYRSVSWCSGQPGTSCLGSTLRRSPTSG